MQQGSTLFLHIVVCTMGLIVLVLSAYVIPLGLITENSGFYSPILVGIYATVFPFYFALFQTLKLLDYIDEGKAFSALSVKALKTIKICALTIGMLYALGMPYIYFAAQQDDAPGVVVIGLICMFAPLAIGVFAAVLQRLLQSAIALQAENDLTV